MENTVPVHLRYKKDILGHLRSAVLSKHGPDEEAKMVAAVLATRGGTPGAASSNASKSGKKPKTLQSSIRKAPLRDGSSDGRALPVKKRHYVKKRKHSTKRRYSTWHGDGTGRGKAIVGVQVFDLSALERRGTLGKKLYASVQLEEMLVHLQRRQPIAVRAHLLTISFHVCPDPSYPCPRCCCGRRRSCTPTRRRAQLTP